VTVTYAAVGDELVARVAYAVSRRVGGAVTRNRVRRRLRAAAAAAGPLRPGAYLVSADPAAFTMAYDALETEVARAMTSASQAAAPVPAPRS
jgi:ribonuclease P protein component